MSTASADVLSFPIDRRMDLVRKMVADLLSLHGDRADTYWRDTAKGLLRDLVARGRSLDDARVEVRSFFASVQTEMRRMVVAGSQQVSA